MLSKPQRLNLSKSFKWVAQGTRKETSSFKLMFRFSEDSPRVGIALTKATFKQANQRNRAKRLTAQAIQTLYPSLRKGLNLVIIPKQEVFKKTPEDLTNELRTIKDIYSDD